MAWRPDQITAYSASATVVLFLPAIGLGIAYPIPDSTAPASDWDRTTWRVDLR